MQDAHCAAQLEVDHHDISKSGLYVLFMAVCNPDGAPVKLEGSIDSLDPCEHDALSADECVDHLIVVQTDTSPRTCLETCPSTSR